MELSAELNSCKESGGRELPKRATFPARIYLHRPYREWFVPSDHIRTSSGEYLVLFARFRVVIKRGDFFDFWGGFDFGGDGQDVHPPPGSSCPLDAKGVAFAVSEGFNGGGDFNDGVADGGEAELLIGEFGFDHAGVVGGGRNFMSWPVLRQWCGR